jgi:hypothetical protein
MFDLKRKYLPSILPCVHEANRMLPSSSMVKPMPSMLCFRVDIDFEGEKDILEVDRLNEESLEER